MATSPGISGGVAGVPWIRSRLPQLLRRAPAPQAQVGGGGYSQLRSYFHTPFASPSARRSPPPPPPRPPPLAPGRRPFFTTSQPPGPAALADMTSASPPSAFPVRTAFPGCHVVAAAAAKQPGTRSPFAPSRGAPGEWRRQPDPAPVAQKFLLCICRPGLLGNGTIPFFLVLSSLLLFIFLLWIFRDRLSLCSSGCPGTRAVAQAGFKLTREIHRVLGLKAIRFNCGMNEEALGG